jgi:hypothetical protein
MVMGEPPSGDSACADMATAEATSTVQHITLANACNAMRQILRKKWLLKQSIGDSGG